MRFKILIILLFVFSFLFFFDSVLAIGVGAKPSFLDLELKVGQPEKTKILVYNISQEAGIFQVFPDQLNEWIEIEPNNFRLEAGENKEVKITVLAKEDGRKTTNLSILAKPLNRRSFGALSGIKIPLRLNIEEKGPSFLASILNAIRRNWVLSIMVFITLVAILIVFYLIRYFKLWELFLPR